MCSDRGLGLGMRLMHWTVKYTQFCTSTKSLLYSMTWTLGVDAEVKLHCLDEADELTTFVFHACDYQHS